MSARTWLANGVVLFVVVTCVRLGFWQLARFEERSAIATQRVERHAAPPLTSLTGDLVDLDYRRVRLAGHYTKGFAATGGIPYSLNGYAALGVFQVDDGPMVLVQRGWVPALDWEAHVDPPTQPTVIEGVLTTAEGAADVRPSVDGRTGRSLWPLGRERFLVFLSRGVAIPWPSILAHEGVTTPVVVVLGPELPNLEERNVNQLPAGGYTTYLKTEHHEHYAWQWFAFAIIAAGLRLWFGWKAR